MKKIIKKKLDEITEEELEQLEDKYCCKGTPFCINCPLSDSLSHACLTHFVFWKDEYERNKDKEFDVEVEE